MAKPPLDLTHGEKLASVDRKERLHFFRRFFDCAGTRFGVMLLALVFWLLPRGHVYKTCEIL